MAGTRCRSLASASGTAPAGSGGAVGRSSARSWPPPPPFLVAGFLASARLGYEIAPSSSSSAAFEALACHAGALSIKDKVT